MKSRFQRRCVPRRQAGFVLLMLALLAAMVILSLAVAVPVITTELRRDKEDELIHRGAQYARAVKKFQKKFGRYPTSIDQLVDTNRYRSLRKKYKDPITGKDFRLLHLGEVQVSIQGKMNTLGSGTNNIFGNPGGQGTSSIFSNPSGQGTSSNPSGSTGTGSSTGQSGSSGPSTSSSGPSTSSSGPNTSSSGPSASSSGPSPSSSGPGTSSSGPNTSSSGPNTSGGFVSLSQMGATGQTFGGGPIIGVASTSKKESFHVFDTDKNHYDQWMFVYDPQLDRGGLIKGPYDGPPKFAGAGQMQPGGMGPGGMTPGGMTPGGITPGGMTPGAPTAGPPR